MSNLQTASDADLLPDGSRYAAWERPLRFTHAYYVNNRHPAADDANPGSPDRPWRTISRAAELLQPGERVIIAGGVYRESVHPAHGGTSPEEMISYEAEPGAAVVIKGSIILQDAWRPSDQWNLHRGVRQPEGEPRVWQLRLDGSRFGGYNPFGLLNMIPDTTFLGAKDLSHYILKRGMLFYDGIKLQQVNLPYQLAQSPGCFWCEHNGLTIHVRFPDDADPAGHTIEAASREQVFAPEEYFLGYIRLKGLTFEHAANAFPVPQRGLVSTARGHHWIIEDCTIQDANSIGLDLGNECWHHVPPPEPFSQHIIRGCTIRRCGIAAIEALGGRNLLIEDNLIEDIGFQMANDSSESAGVKVHEQHGMLFRRNVLRRITGCPALWLDWDNANCRVSANVLADISGHWSFGAIHLECNHGPNWVDNNIIWDVQGEEGWEWTIDNFKQVEREGSGICLRGMDHLLIAHNLFGRCSNAAIWPVHVPYRMMHGRGGTSRDIRFLNNIVYACGQAGVVFDNAHNQAEGNLYSRLPEGALQVLHPEPLCLDLAAWRECFGFDFGGQAADGVWELDSAALVLRGAPPHELVPVPGCGIRGDLLGADTSAEARLPGPFSAAARLAGGSVDPRRKHE
ncbi:MAG: right-handed parallel beta-helix repeat-containing protein [Chloroflexi bacterium]|nr:right-handed parallel beta-helix repeat-containing protein [Chloroflexota bacterium]